MLIEQIYQTLKIAFLSKRKLSIISQVRVESTPFIVPHWQQESIWCGCWEKRIISDFSIQRHQV